VGGEPVVVGDDLADRYGRQPRAARRPGLRWVVAAVTVAGLALVAWVGYGILSVPVRTQDAGFEIVDATAIDVTFVVVRDPDATVTCRVRALSPSFAEVGVKDVLVGPGEEATAAVRVRVTTSEAATTGVVDSCTVVGRS
jgi:hypothetical protein